MVLIFLNLFNDPFKTSRFNFGRIIRSYPNILRCFEPSNRFSRTFSYPCKAFARIHKGNEKQKSFQSGQKTFRCDTAKYRVYKK